MSNETELIAQLRQGLRPAFDALVEMYKNKGFAICYNLLGNIEDTKDVLQEVFLKVYFNIQKFREESNFSTWFYRIAVNCSLDFLRRQKKAKKCFFLKWKVKKMKREIFRIRATNRQKF